MLRIDTSRAREGMILGAQVAHPHTPGRVLLKPGYRLDTSALSRLHELGVRQIWVRYPALGEVAHSPSTSMLQRHMQLVSSLDKVFDHCGERCSVDFEYDQYASVVRGLVDQLHADPLAASCITDMMGASPSLGEHAAAVCFLSIMMGLKLETYLLGQRKRLGGIAAKHVENMGLGALLHDAGLLKIPHALRHLRDDPSDRERLKLSPEQIELWRSHAQVGWRIVHEHVEPTAASVVLHHHQRTDGLGFPSVDLRDGPPRPLHGEEIHVFARIVAVADQFDELQRARPGEQPETVLPTVGALKEMVDRARAGRVDAVVLKALTAVMPPFAPGTLVELSNGQPAVVTHHNPLRPCRPKVRRVRSHEIPADLHEQWLEEEIDLASELALHVCKAEGRSVERHLFEPMTAEEFDLRIQRTADNRAA
ncbi:MAG: HD domain-containing protein [Phycisphaerales bacterium]|nr:HD domain-containing protein [Phycisphaerales bacterium]